MQRHAGRHMIHQVDITKITKWISAIPDEYIAAICARYPQPRPPWRGRLGPEHVAELNESIAALIKPPAGQALIRRGFSPPARALPPDSLLVTPAAPTRRPRRATLVSVAKQASKAGIAVARYEVKPDGTIVIVTGQGESTEPNPWLDDLKVTKQ